MLAAGWFDSAITSNGSGVLTTLGLVVNGTIVLQNPASAQTLTNGSTITIPGPYIKVTESGAVTGIIMTAGATPGQLVYLYNSGTGSLTFAASGSNMRNGSNVTVNGGRILTMIWDGGQWGESANP